MRRADERGVAHPGFNSTLVLLKVGEAERAAEAADVFGFNSTLVLLKAPHSRQEPNEQASFNSTLVLLKGNAPR